MTLERRAAACTLLALLLPLAVAGGARAAAGAGAPDSPDSATAGPVPIEVRSEGVPLDPANPGRTRVGELEYRGGLALRSSSTSFGGFSGLHVGPDGRLEAVGDQGTFLTARVVHDAAGRLSGLADAALGRLLGLDGKRLGGKVERDAESLARLPGGGLLVGFEHRHRLWLYPDGLVFPPRPFPGPPGLDRAPANGGLEAVAALPDGRVLALSEDWEHRNALRGWRLEHNSWRELAWRREGLFRPSDASATPSGDVLVLERSFDERTLQVGGRLMSVRARDLRPGAVLQGRLVAELMPPLTTDNYEGVSCVKGADGLTWVYVLSDDNFNPLQRTLLLLFAWDEGRSGDGQGSPARR